MLFHNLFLRRALPQSKRFLALSTSKAERKGLLKGANSEFFTTDLNATEACDLVQNSDVVFRDAIARDLQNSELGHAAKYLNAIEERASLYLTEDELCGRIEICGEIKKAMLKRGNLVFVTGGRSVGKSKILHSIVKDIASTQSTPTGQAATQPRVSMVMVNGRAERDLVAALSGVASSKSVAFARRVVSMLLSAASFTYTASTGEAYGFDMKAVNFANMSVSGAVTALANSHPPDTTHTVLILDEANVYLNCTGDHTAATRAQQLYQAVVNATKQQTLMTVLLVSSDEGLPFHLQTLGLNQEHITRIMVIGEPTPSQCRDLLQKKFGVGEHLTNALLSYYGGHVYQIVKLLELLPTAFELNQPIEIFKRPAGNVGRALNAWLAEGGEESEILPVLGELSRTGFVAMSPDDKLGQLLTKHNVCAFLTDDAVEYHVPRGLRAKREGLVPTSQLIRVLIPWKLQQIRDQQHHYKDQTSEDSEDRKVEAEGEK